MSNYTHLKKNGFTFKRFFVAHDKSPMKITTDSVLLAAWTPLLSQPQRVLDIGSGCGVIAIMLAQRLAHINNVTIDAVEINQDACSQCQDNVAHSPFDSVYVYCADINQFGIDDLRQYDLIVTNPPYFLTAVPCRDENRQTARYTKQLSHLQLIVNVKRLLSKQGLFCLVLPFLLADDFKKQCEENRLYLCQQTNVRYMVDKDFSLSLLCFSLSENPKIIIDELCMRKQDNTYTDSFAHLLKDFYLRF